MDFEGQVAVVTGSATGLGATSAIAMARRGLKGVVLSCARSVDDLEATAAACREAGCAVRTVVGDIAEDATSRALAQAAAGWGRVDIAVANAGMTRHVPDHADMEALSPDDFARIYAVNVTGAFLTVRALKSLLQASHGAHGHAASVVMTSSIAGVSGIGSSVAYAASKGALNTMTLSLARALAPAIRVNALCPGYIDTRWFPDAFGEERTAMIREQVRRTTPLQAASGPEDVADVLLFLASRASRHITGETLLVDAGLHLNYAPLAAR
jgi:3-oxoacyl-[acyl-carrier protein] reductase